jgi:hydroxyacylglutathione hydrolase
MQAKREELAKTMYHTIQQKFTHLPNDAIVYPAHGAGSLCGKSMSDANSSTLGNERMGNWAFKKQTQEEFVATLLDSQPFIPSYFGYNVDMNKKGAETLREAIAGVPFKLSASTKGLLVDVREETQFKKGHLKGSINIQATSEEAKFETWLGAIVEPEEKFSLVIDKPEDLELLLQRVAKIGYEKQLQEVLTTSNEHLLQMKPLDLQDFKKNPDNYTIIDIRNQSEIKEGKFFEKALEHPLNELRESAKNIPINKPIVVHCAGGYRSAAGSSILENQLEGATVYDLSDDVNQFKD